MWVRHPATWIVDDARRWGASGLFVAGGSLLRASIGLYRRGIIVRSGLRVVFAAARWLERAAVELQRRPRCPRDPNGSGDR
jgi:choline dehydrogenase-like flavoprotein